MSAAALRTLVHARGTALLARAWRALRELSGDAAYEEYLEHAGERPLSREAFYLDSLRRRYGRPSRCC